MATLPSISNAVCTAQVAKIAEEEVAIAKADVATSTATAAAAQAQYDALYPGFAFDKQARAERNGAFQGLVKPAQDNLDIAKERLTTTSLLANYMRGFAKGVAATQVDGTCLANKEGLGYARETIRSGTVYERHARHPTKNPAEVVAAALKEANSPIGARYQ